jgi:hypothetical protein
MNEILSVHNMWIPFAACGLTVAACVFWMFTAK